MIIIIIIIIILFYFLSFYFICSKTNDVAMQTKDMDVEQDTPGSDKLLRWLLRKKEKKHGNTQIHKI